MCVWDEVHGTCKGPGAAGERGLAWQRTALGSVWQSRAGDRQPRKAVSTCCLHVAVLDYH